MLNWRFNQTYGTSNVDDPAFEEAYAKASTWEMFLDYDERAKIITDLIPHILDNAWYIQPTAPYVYALWQPWVKLHNGEEKIGYVSIPYWAVYPWIDQDLKEEMTGRR